MKVRRCFGLIAFLVAPFTVVLLAAGFESKTADLPLPQTSGSLWDVLFRMLAAFLFVISIFVLGAWLFKRSRLFSLYQGGSTQLRILESRSLGYRNSLFVVGYNQHRFLLAASATGVSLLSPLPDASPIAAKGSDLPSFSEQLNAVHERKA